MNDLSSISTVILAGGVGSRLKSVVADRPKVLAEVAGRPFLTYLLDQLHDAGVRRVILSIGFMADAVRDLLGDSYGEVSLSYSEERRPLGTGGALRLALPHCSSEPILVLNGDSYFRADFKEFLTQFRERSVPAALLLAPVEDVHRFGQVTIDAAGWVQRFDEKGAGTGSGWINAGVYLFRRAVLEAIPAGQAVSLEREVFPNLIENGLLGCRQRGAFLDIGTPESYRQAEAFFTEGRRDFEAL